MWLGMFVLGLAIGVRPGRRGCSVRPGARHPPQPHGDRGLDLRKSRPPEKEPRRRGGRPGFRLSLRSRQVAELLPGPASVPRTRWRRHSLASGRGMRPVYAHDRATCPES
ncbi:uncharacterized protein LOC134788765 [Penaeus indicus]|uniref:uncharacterized protein LOC134788765 n=1 Tax=Penaeus indicus TaxID=29960 RepID=UPI00300C7F40